MPLQFDWLSYIEVYNIYCTYTCDRPSFGFYINVLSSHGLATVNNMKQYRIAYNRIFTISHIMLPV